MMTLLQAKRLQNLYYYQGLENVRVIHTEYGEGRVEGIAGDGSIFVIYSNGIKSSIYFDHENLTYPAYII